MYSKSHYSKKLLISAQQYSDCEKECINVVKVLIHILFHFTGR